MNPADRAASPFGWHDTNGAAGAEFTTTQGNNVHGLYRPQRRQHARCGQASPDGGPSLVFDFPLDLTQEPPAYRPAAVTNLFYWNNIIHDVMYGYGFDRGRRELPVQQLRQRWPGGDDVRAEAQDGSGLNNANFFTPPDGMRPRMQMFEWTPPITAPSTRRSPLPADYAAGSGGLRRS